MKFVGIIICVLVVISCNNMPEQFIDHSVKKNLKPLRYGMVTGLKTDKVEYYKRLHASPWPSVQKRIAECNIQNYSIYLQKIEAQYYLFSYFEYTGSDFDKDMQKMAADTATQRWWKETDPCQMPIKEALAKHQIWSDMQEVFHLD